MTSLTRLLAAALPAVLLGCATPVQMSLDTEMARLCAQDGGVTVFERVLLPYPGFRIRGTSFAPNAPYFLQGTGVTLQHGNGTPLGSEYVLSRSVAEIVRASDSKVVSRLVTYIRYGGDVPGPWHGSGRACPTLPPGALERATFEGWGQ